jgi:hypothetical protein
MNPGHAPLGPSVQMVKRKENAPTQNTAAHQGTNHLKYSHAPVT